MKKESREQKALERARRKLAKAKLKLEVAEERYAQVRERGKQDIRAAQLRAAERQGKASVRLEKRQQAVSRAEARLAELSGLELPGSPAGEPAEIITLDTGSAELST